MIIRNSERGINTNLDSIQTSLNEESSGGAFYCEYPIFRDLFQLERRSIQRTGELYLSLPADSYRDRRKNSKEHDPFKKQWNAFQILPLWLPSRCSDVFTRYSISQYLILLPTVTIEKGGMGLKTYYQQLPQALQPEGHSQLDPVCNRFFPWKNTLRRNLKLRRTDRRRP